MKRLRDHGQVKKYYHDVEGYNGRLDAIQAGILNTKLPHLEDWNSSRREVAARYGGLLTKTEGITLPYEPVWSRPVYHLYVVRTSNRDGLIGHLKEANIGTGIHYPIPLHLQKAYSALGYLSGDFPAAEKVASEIVSLPMFPNLTGKQQERIAKEIAIFAAKYLQLENDKERATISSAQAN